MTSTPTRPVDNIVITTKGLQDRNINVLDGTTVENKGKLILPRYSTTAHSSLKLDNPQSRDHKEKSVGLVSRRNVVSYTFNDKASLKSPS